MTNTNTSNPTDKIFADDVPALPADATAGTWGGVAADFVCLIGGRPHAAHAHHGMFLVVDLDSYARDGFTCGARFANDEIVRLPNRPSLAAAKTPKTKRAIDFTCPRCNAKPGRPCRGERTPSASTLGGGWGGPATLAKPHAERYAVRRATVNTPAERERGFDRGNYAAAYTDELAATPSRCTLEGKSIGFTIGYLLGFFSSYATFEVPAEYRAQIAEFRLTYRDDSFVDAPPVRDSGCDFPYDAHSCDGCGAPANVCVCPSA